MFKDLFTHYSSTTHQSQVLKKMDDVIPTEIIWIYPNQQILVNREICAMLTARTAAFNVSKANSDDTMHTRRAGTSSGNPLGIQKDNTDSNWNHNTTA
jgi:hypothetical protein